MYHTKKLFIWQDKKSFLKNTLQKQFFCLQSKMKCAIITTELTRTPLVLRGHKEEYARICFSESRSLVQSGSKAGFSTSSAPGDEPVGLRPVSRTLRGRTVVPNGKLGGNAESFVPYGMCIVHTCGEKGFFFYFIMEVIIRAGYKADSHKP